METDDELKERAVRQAEYERASELLQALMARREARMRHYFRTGRLPRRDEVFVTPPEEGPSWLARLWVWVKRLVDKGEK